MKLPKPKNNIFIFALIVFLLQQNINAVYASSIIKTFDEFSQLTDVVYDSVSNKLYVVNGPNVAVINGQNNEIVKTINLSSGTNNRIAINPKTNKIFVNLFGTINVIDPNTSSVVKEINIYDNELVSVSPANIAINPTTNTIYAKGTNPAIMHSGNNAPGSNFLPDALYAVDAETGNLLGYVEIGNNLDKNTNISDIKVNSKTNKVYILLDDPNNNGIYLTVIDGSKNTIVKKLLISNNYEDFGRIAINETANKIYITGLPFPKVKVIDGTTDELLGEINSSNIDSTVGVAIDESKSEIYAIGNLDSPTIYLIDGMTNNVTGSTVIDNANSAYASYLLFNSNSNTLYLVDHNSSKVHVVNLSNVSSNNTNGTEDSSSLTDNLKEALNNLKSIQKELAGIRSTRAVAAKINSLVKTINKKSQGSVSECTGLSNSSDGLFNSVIELLNTKTCGSIKRKNCIESDIASTYETRLNEVFGNISDIFQTDSNVDSVPDLCKK
ncbi:MAG: hypothetical protein A3B68_01470 [Candidatus Melainabacteria bacterium RIFCSPHIGHO2_02_FULL_34_12]|nr:MAG: hypothetical protein A3B68_01470 [Candidatus Melainabacteria bacterium RIFCSPHIGHO2_02_FULL_34_12]